jgi:hypothetical protein
VIDLNLNLVDAETTIFFSVESVPRDQNTQPVMPKLILKQLTKFDEFLKVLSILQPNHHRFLQGGEGERGVNIGPPRQISKDLLIKIQ